MNVAIADQAPADSRSTWIALLMSVLGLVLLMGWAVRHQSLLMPESLNPFKTRLALTAEQVPDGMAASRPVADVVPDTLPAAGENTSTVAAPDPVPTIEKSPVAESIDEAPIAEALVAEAPIVDEQAVDAPVAEPGAVAADNIGDSLPLNTSSETAPEPTESPFERLRRQELAAVPELSAKLVFEPRVAQIQQESIAQLDQLFELLFIYAETSVLITIDSAEFEKQNNNAALSQARAEMLVDYLVERGLRRERFEIAASGGQGIEQGTHRVSVQTSVNGQ